MHSSLLILVAHRNALASRRKSAKIATKAIRALLDRFRTGPGRRRDSHKSHAWAIRWQVGWPPTGSYAIEIPVKKSWEIHKKWIRFADPTDWK